MRCFHSRFSIALAASFSFACGSGSSDGAAGSGGTAGTGGRGMAGSGMGGGAGSGGSAGAVVPYPAPDAWGPNAGPGGPATSFSESELMVQCSFLDGGPQDFDHHNLVAMFDGYLLLPWAPEQSGGGLSFFDISDPCNPSKVGESEFSQQMREPHSVGFADVDDRWWVVVDGMEQFAMLGGVGVQFWDITDVTAPAAVAGIGFEGTFYPDAYARVTLSAFWQGRYVYSAGADTGVWIVDAADPANPVQVGHYEIEPTMRTGQIQAIGNLLIVTTAEGPRTVLLDISDPTRPQPIPGGDFLAQDSNGLAREAYFTNMVAGHVYYANKSGGGGILAWDIRDPENPTRAGESFSGGNGGYVFVNSDFAFAGESSQAVIYDVSSVNDIAEHARFTLDPVSDTERRDRCNAEPMFFTGDLDTATPVGNIMVLSADDNACNDRASAVVPWARDVDTQPPRVAWSWPNDGATGLAPTSRIGVSFSEFVDPKSAFAGSVRLYEADTTPEETRVDGRITTQEGIVNFEPTEPLAPNTRYTFEIPAGGVVDYNGNPVAESFELTFTTGP